MTVESAKNTDTTTTGCSRFPVDQRGFPGPKPTRRRAGKGYALKALPRLLSRFRTPICYAIGTISGALSLVIGQMTRWCSITRGSSAKLSGNAKRRSNFRCYRACSQAPHLDCHASQGSRPCSATSRHDSTCSPRTNERVRLGDYAQFVHRRCEAQRGITSRHCRTLRGVRRWQ